MTLLQKKEKLILEVQKLSDTEFIDYLLKLIELESKPIPAKDYMLTTMENKAIDIAEDDLKAGNVITDEEADEQIRSWL